MVTAGWEESVLRRRRGCLHITCLTGRCGERWRDTRFNARCWGPPSHPCQLPPFESLVTSRNILILYIEWMNKVLLYSIGNYIHYPVINHNRKEYEKEYIYGTSLVVQWLRICLPMQGTWVRSLVWEDPTCHGATKPMHHNYWACEPQLLKPACLQPVLRDKRSHCNEKPMRFNKE